MIKIKDKNKKLIKVIGWILGICLALVIAFVIYASFYYKADEEALSVYKDGEDIVEQKPYTILETKEKADTGIIFYPGAKVEGTAYLPLLEQLRREGYLTILVDMPLNFAFLGGGRAEGAMELYPEIENWYIMGHSLGGVAASTYAEKNQEKLDGLIVLGAYVYGDYPIEKSLTIYGSLDEQNTDYEENIVVIEGGNHAQFGNYGAQKGDAKADISWEEQQEITVEAIKEYIER